jgi:hypothetical protein
MLEDSHHLVGLAAAILHTTTGHWISITAMRRVIRRISGPGGRGRGGVLFRRKSHHRKWHSRHFRYVTLREREIYVRRDSKEVSI